MVSSLRTYGMTRSVRKARWLTLGVEAVLIVFSVLLALALDEWRQGIADRRRVARVQETIRDELARNREQVAGRLSYHEAMQKATASFLEQNVVENKAGYLSLKRRPRWEELGIKRGIGAGSLGRTGWELALLSGALEHMGYEMMTALSGAYAQQEEEERTKAEVVQRLGALYSAYFREEDLGGELIAFSGSLVDLVLREQELVAEYDRALAMLDAGKTPTR